MNIEKWPTVKITGIISVIFLIVIWRNIDEKTRGHSGASTLLVHESIIDQGVLAYQIDVGKLPEKFDDLLKNPGYKKWNGPYLIFPLIPQGYPGFKYELAIIRKNGIAHLYEPIIVAKSNSTIVTCLYCAIGELRGKYKTVIDFLITRIYLH